MAELGIMALRNLRMNKRRRVRNPPARLFDLITRRDGENSDSEARGCVLHNRNQKACTPNQIH